MSGPAQTAVGSIVSLWRYPVKSMMGGELNASEVTTHGLAGDRAYALVDRSDGKVATAKNPRKWPRLFDFRAAYVDTPQASAPVRLTMPDGTTVTSVQADRDGVLTRALGREVTLETTSNASPRPASAEEYWPDM